MANIQIIQGDFEKKLKQSFPYSTQGVSILLGMPRRREEGEKKERRAREEREKSEPTPWLERRKISEEWDKVPL